MSREILFKAKRTDSGEWMKGAYSRFYENSGKLLHMIFVNYENEKRSQPVDIDPSTLCQYTGLTDKNDKKIWENDIVLIHSNSIDEEDGYFTVEWYGEDAMFKMSGDGLTTDFNSFYGYECEVVGNIFNNPELLKGGHRIDKMKITDRLRVYAQAYKEPPTGTEIEGTVELLEEAADYIEKICDKESRDRVFRRCICDYGSSSQIDVTIEEMSELIKALLKWKRADLDGLATGTEAIIDELADVRIMARQMEILFQCEDEVERRIDFKVQRQTERLDKWEAEHGKD